MAREVWRAHQDGGIGSGSDWSISSRKGRRTTTHTSDGGFSSTSSGCAVTIVAGLLAGASVIPTLVDLAGRVT